MYSEVKQDSLEDVVESFAPLVKRIVFHMVGRLPSSVSADDLMQAGLLGLMEAAQRYDANKGASFETYAGIRIRGAIVDEMRRGDWAPRSVHRNSRRIAAAIRQVESCERREAKDAEIAKVLEVSNDEYYSMLQDTSGTRLFSYEEYTGNSDELGFEVAGDSSFNPIEGIQAELFKENLAQEVDGLPEREKLVLALYYDEELNLREIGEILGVSESRVSQIHSQAALRLRSRLKDWVESDTKSTQGASKSK
ncbi:MAG: RNA polymerase sigma factor FliA [Gammaproteobacteria bacterium]|nr:MAG: RNA polymerase sigma factor FliA [Gammaproteobacteria bacterium]